MHRVLIIGFGNVGRTLAVMMSENSARLNSMGLDFRVIGVFTRSRGSVSDEQGLDMQKLLDDVSSHGRFTESLTSITPLEACRELDYDVMVELSPLNVKNKGEPAVSHISAALARGKHVVTANKGPVAFAYQKLARLALDNGCRFLFESTVMDGSPLFNLVSRCMRVNTITGFTGILNSTTNYVLTRMETGLTMDEAVREAIEMGAAEADPSNDIDGWDAAAKTAVLSRVLLGANITPLEVRRSGIRDVTPQMVADAAARGKRLKLICRGQIKDGLVEASVGVEEVDKDDAFTTLSFRDSGLCLESNLLSPHVIIHKKHKKTTVHDTAYGVLEDMTSVFVP